MSELADIMSDVLLKADVALEAEAIAFTKDELPDPADGSICRRWLRTNVDLQERINTLKLGIQTRLKRKTNELKKVEASIREELKDEGFRAFEERSVMCHREARYRDFNDEVVNLEALYNRLDFIEWSLKNLARYLIK